MKDQLNSKVMQWVKATLILLAMSITIFSGEAYAQSSMNIGDVAEQVTSTFGQFAQLITAASYIAGLGFAVAAILKFKAHKDNPQQITVGTPIALMFVAAALIFLPSMFQVAGQTLFGTTGSAAGVTGITSF